MGYSLSDNMQAVIDKMKDCNFLPDEEDRKLIVKLAEKFSFDLGQRWLWDSTRQSETYDYNNNPGQWETIFRELLSRFADQIFLVVSDDEFYPWKVLQCKKDECVNLLNELPYFELFIFDDFMKTVVFDTHHNCLIVSEGSAF
jgi:hypothetical protein